MLFLFKARKLAKKDHDIIILYRSRNRKRNHYSIWGTPGCARERVKTVKKQWIKMMFAGVRGMEIYRIV